MGTALVCYNATERTTLAHIHSTLGIEDTLMTEITINDYTAENSLVYYSIKVGDWEVYDNYTGWCFQNDYTQSQVEL
jgi:hypothetical protein